MPIGSRFSTPSLMPSLSCHPLRATPRPLTPVRRERTRGSSRAGFAPPRGRADRSIVSVKICCLKDQVRVMSALPPKADIKIASDYVRLSSSGNLAILAAIRRAAISDTRNPGSAKYHWAKFPAVVTEGSVNYCAIVDAQSPYAAYNGRQAYIVETQMSGNRVSSAVIGLIAGGKDFAIVTNMCAKYGLDPRNAS